jgi:hypothetical protein
MPFAPPHNAGMWRDGRVAADNSPVSRVTGPSSFTFGGYTWQTHATNAPPVQHKWECWYVRQGECGHRLGTGPDAQADPVRLEDPVERCRGWDHAYIYFRDPRVYFQGSDCSFGFGRVGFLYATNSVTEIDMEQVGNKPNTVDCTNWKGLSNFQGHSGHGVQPGEHPHVQDCMAADLGQLVR